MGVEDNLFQIQDLDAQTTFYDWVSKENNEIIEKLNLLNVYTVKGGTGINVVLGTTANAGLTLINGVTLTYTTGEALVSLNDEVPGVTFAGSVVVTGNLQVQDGTKATTIVTSVNGSTGAVTILGITGATGITGSAGVAPQPIVLSENQLINGALDIWQRGTTFTGSTAMQYFADRWAIFYKTQTGENTNTTDIIRQKFESNQTDVAGSPKYYANLHFDRAVLRSSSDLIGVENRMENPTKFLDEKIYVDGYVRGGTQENLGLYIRRSPDGVTHYAETFGSGDLPKGTTWASFLSSHVVRYRKGVTYTVKVVDGGAYNYYTINGVTQGGLTLDRGFEYTFDLSDSSLNTHPFALSTTQNGTHNNGSQYHTGYSHPNGATQGIAGAQARLKVSYGAPDTLYYYCKQHPGMTHATGMGGTGSVRGALATEDGYVAVGLDLTRSAHATGDGITLDYAKFRVFSSQTIQNLTTSPYREESDVDKELRDCSRFYQRSFGLGEETGDTTTISKNTPNFSPVRFTLSPNGEYYHEFETEMRKTPTVTVFSPHTGVTSDAFNKSSGLDLRLSSGTSGYAGANRIHVAGATTITTDPVPRGILIQILSGSVPFDDIFVNYVADSDFSI